MSLFVIMIVVLYYFCSCNGFYFCPSGSKELDVFVINKKHDVIFTHSNLSDLAPYSLDLEVTWDVVHESVTNFDGYLFCMTETKKNSMSSDKENSFALPERKKFFTGNETSSKNDTETKEDFFFRCKNYLGREFWLTDDQGNYRECGFPCERVYNSCSPVVGSVCQELGKGCIPIRRDKQSMKVEIDFGKSYRYNIFPYKGYDVSLEFNPTIYEISVFCSDFLIENEKLPRRTSLEFCKNKTADVGMYFGSSKVLHFSYNVTRNFEANQTKLTLYWVKPHEVKNKRKITAYYVFSNETAVIRRPSHVGVKTPEDEEVNPYYNITLVFRGVAIDYRLKVRITPVTETTDENSKCVRGCDERGEALVADIFVPGFDPCQNESHFCTPLASCNYSTKRRTEWKRSCKCPIGYDGDGIKKSIMSSGSECRDLDACLTVGLLKCVPTATCVDASPPSLDIADCVCRSGYYGNGRVKGSGCTSSSIVIICSIVAVLLFIASIVLAIFLSRKSHRKRLFDSALRRYVTKNSNHYSSSLHLNVPGGLLPGNHNYVNSEPVFGRKLEVDRKRVTKKEIIGRGNFGIVYKAMLVDDDGKEGVVAVKCLSDPHSPEYRTEFLAEMSLLAHLSKHENILSVIGVCTVQPPHASDSESLSPLLITEYMVYGDLLHFLWNARDPGRARADPIYNFTEQSLYNIGHQVAHGMEFLRHSRIIHGDLAARNILVGQNLQVKISDFGLANDVYRYGFIKGAIERKVPFCWISPERMSGGKNPITWKSDVWSLGILLYEMVTLGASPYPSMDRLTIYSHLQNGYRMAQPASCSDHLYQIMLSCWEWDSTKRPTFKVLEKKLEGGVDWKNMEDSDPLLSRIEHLCDIDQSSYKREIEIKTMTPQTKGEFLSLEDPMGRTGLSNPNALATNGPCHALEQTNECFLPEG